MRTRKRMARRSIESRFIAVLKKEQTMRYIEAEEVEKRIDVVIGSEPKAWDKKALKELKMYVVHAVPTADVRENVHGEWIRHDGRWLNGDYYPTRYECNQCHHFVGVARDKNFCPNCGADMRQKTANPMGFIKVPKMPTATQPINGEPTISPLGADMRGEQHE